MRAGGGVLITIQRPFTIYKAPKKLLLIGAILPIASLFIPLLYPQNGLIGLLFGIGGYALYYLWLVQKSRLDWHFENKLFIALPMWQGKTEIIIRRGPKLSKFKTPK